MRVRVGYFASCGGGFLLLFPFITRSDSSSSSSCSCSILPFSSDIRGSRLEVGLITAVVVIGLVRGRPCIRISICIRINVGKETLVAGTRSCRTGLELPSDETFSGNLNIETALSETI